MADEGGISLKVDGLAELQAKLDAMTLQDSAQIRIDQGKKYQPRLLAYVSNDTFELSLAAHQRVEMFLDLNAFELGARCLGDGIERLSRCIRNEMQMEVTRFVQFYPQGCSVRCATFHRQDRSSTVVHAGAQPIHLSFPGGVRPVRPLESSAAAT